MENVVTEITQYIEEHAVMDKGLLWSFLRADTNRPPLNREDYTGGNWQDRDTWKESGVPEEPGDWLPYEDSMYTTGYYLTALTLEYQETAELVALERAQRCAKVFWWIFQIGQEVERGFMPKPYGLKCSKQWSGDNQGPMFHGLSVFYRIATTEQRTKIAEILSAASNYYLRYNHCPPLPYFGEEIIDYTSDHYYPGFWPLLFMPLHWAAYQATGDRKYRIAYEQLRDKRLRIDVPIDIYRDMGVPYRWVQQLLHLLDMGAPPIKAWQCSARKWIQVFRERKTAECWPPLHKLPLLCATLVGGQENEVKKAWQEVAHWQLKDALYAQPGDSRIPQGCDWWSEVYIVHHLTEWLELYWELQVHGK